MFDAVRETRPPLRTHLSHEAQPEMPVHDSAYYLIHIASSPPNSAVKPSWNTNPALDDVSWASLPSELLKVCPVTLECLNYIYIIKLEEDYVQHDPYPTNTRANGPPQTRKHVFLATFMDITELLTRYLALRSLLG